MINISNKDLTMQSVTTICLFNSILIRVWFQVGKVKKMKKRIVVIFQMILLFCVITAFSARAASAAAAAEPKATFRLSAYGTYLSCAVSGLENLKGGSIILTYDSENVVFETMTEENWSSSVHKVKDGELEICFHLPEGIDGYGFFNTMVMFHRIGYGDAAVKVKHVEIYDSDGKTYESENDIAVSYAIENTAVSEAQWFYDEDTQTLTISGTENTPDYVREEGAAEAQLPPWSAYKDKVKKIVVEEGVKGIGNNNFSDFSMLETVVLPHSMMRIAEGSFPSAEDAEVTVVGKALSAAERYAYQAGYAFCPDNAFLRGDLDESGSYNAEDALFVLKMVVKLMPEYSYSADVDANGTVDAADALLILKHVVKIIDKFPAEYVYGAYPAE